METTWQGLRVDGRYGKGEAPIAPWVHPLPVFPGLWADVAAIPSRGAKALKLPVTPASNSCQHLLRPSPPPGCCPLPLPYGPGFDFRQVGFRYASLISGMQPPDFTVLPACWLGSSTGYWACALLPMQGGTGPSLGNLLSATKPGELGMGLFMPISL